MTRRPLLPAVAALALLCGAGAGTAAAASQPPPPATSAVPAPPPTAPTPAVPAAPATPATPATPAVPATPAAPAAPARKASPDAWAAPSAARLVAAGAWPELAGDDLSRDATRGDLDRAIGAITGTRPASPNPAAPATAWQSHLLVVRALGLEPERRGIARIAVDGGGVIRMPRFAGSEVLARELGLVYNQPSSQDGRERAKGQPLRLADLAYMADRARGVTPWQRAGLARYRDIRLPAMTPQRLAVVQAAVWQIGQPYVWGGDWPGVRSPWGAQAHGGFDCSGLVWWAFKGSAGPSQMSLGSDLRGRTADAMAWERPAEREPADAAEPGDLVFFGPKGPASPKGSISHTAIALGNGWMVQSSGSRGGVSITWLATYWPSATAWARRVAQLGA
ncbi:MAG TPA: NlpC/P60 family protein [Miltoncostaea sp.]|nr:NlpC/P60 family protein [Miltoncostaea sp.]